jgi:hypothetical protein
VGNEVLAIRVAAYACRAHAGRLEAEMRPSPYGKIADAAGGITRTHGPG